MKRLLKKQSGDELKLKLNLTARHYYKSSYAQTPPDVVIAFEDMNGFYFTINKSDEIKEVSRKEFNDIIRYGFIDEYHQPIRFYKLISTKDIDVDTKSGQSIVEKEVLKKMNILWKQEFGETVEIQFSNFLHGGMCGTKYDFNGTLFLKEYFWYEKDIFRDEISFYHYYYFDGELHLEEISEKEMKEGIEEWKQAIGNHSTIFFNFILEEYPPQSVRIPKRNIKVSKNSTYGK